MIAHEEETERSRQKRDQIYSCLYCRFIHEHNIGNLNPVDELKYLFHMKYAHHLER